MPLGGKYKIVNLWEKKKKKPPPLSLFAPWNDTLTILVIYSSMLHLTNCEQRLVIVIIPTLGYFSFVFVILKQSLFVGGEDNVACLLAAQGQGPGIMQVHYTYKIP